MTLNAYTRRHELLWVVLCVLVSACTATPPSGVFVCSADPHCPSTQVCDLASGRCVGYADALSRSSQTGSRAAPTMPTDVMLAASGARASAVIAGAQGNDLASTTAGVMSVGAAGSAAAVSNNAARAQAQAATPATVNTASAGTSAAVDGGSAGAVQASAVAGRVGAAGVSGRGGAGGNTSPAVAGSGGAGGSENVGGAGGAGGKKATIDDLPEWLVNPSTWFCIQTNGGCACIDGEGQVRDTCRKPKQTCCYVLTSEDIANCQCYADNSEECAGEGSSAAAVRVDTCPPTR